MPLSPDLLQKRVEECFEMFELKKDEIYTTSELFHICNKKIKMVDPRFVHHDDEPHDNEEVKQKKKYERYLKVDAMLSYMYFIHEELKDPQNSNNCGFVYLCHRYPQVFKNTQPNLSAGPVSSYAGNLKEYSVDLSFNFLHRTIAENPTSSNAIECTIKFKTPQDFLSQFQEELRKHQSLGLNNAIHLNFNKPNNKNVEPDAAAIIVKALTDKRVSNLNIVEMSAMQGFFNTSQMARFKDEINYYKSIPENHPFYINFRWSYSGKHSIYAISQYVYEEVDDKNFDKFKERLQNELQEMEYRNEISIEFARCVLPEKFKEEFYATLMKCTNFTRVTTRDNDSCQERKYGISQEKFDSLHTQAEKNKKEVERKNKQEKKRLDAKSILPNDNNLEVHDLDGRGIKAIFSYDIISGPELTYRINEHARRQHTKEQNNIKIQAPSYTQVHLKTVNFDASHLDAQGFLNMLLMNPKLKVVKVPKGFWNYDQKLEMLKHLKKNGAYENRYERWWPFGGGLAAGIGLFLAKLSLLATVVYSFIVLAALLLVSKLRNQSLDKIQKNYLQAHKGLEDKSAVTPEKIDALYKGYEDRKWKNYLPRFGDMNCIRNYRSWATGYQAAMNGDKETILKIKKLKGM